MLQKLRRRLVGVSILALAIVLGVILAAADLINRRAETNQADEILAMLDEQNGEFSDQPADPNSSPGIAGESASAAGESTSDPGESASASGESASDPGESAPQQGASLPAPPTIPGTNLSPETPFESRYFSVTLDESGQIVSINLDHIASVNDTSARELAAELSRKNGGSIETTATSSGSFIETTATSSSSSATTQAASASSAGSSSAASGEAASSGDRYFPVQGTKCWLRGFRCLVTTNDSGQTMLLFLDRGSRLSSLRSSMYAYLGISLAGLGAVFVLILIFSGRIMRPFAENYEKQRRFITDAGHELKTPIAVIEADSDVLEMDLGPNEWVEDIHKQTERLTGLTQNLISLARMEEAGSNYIMIDFPVSEVFTESLDSCRGPALAKKIRLTAETDQMLTLCGDEKAIRRLIGILMDNAIKYTPEGGEIRAGLHRRGRQIELTVWNTAESVPKESVPHLFERFYRADASRSSETGGYGIGLSIAQAIVTAHHGKIRAKTDDEKSLLITAIFPAPKPDTSGLED